jgi:putative heme-binding domain-containing protein
MAATIPVAAAVERWADPAVPVTSGLVLWLDAGREVAPGLWHDASGNKRNATRPAAAAPTSLRGAGAKGAVSFDDKSNPFAIHADGLRLPEATVVIFARATPGAGGAQTLLTANSVGSSDAPRSLNIRIGGNAAASEIQSLEIEGAGVAEAKNMLPEPVAKGAPFILFVHLGSDSATASVSGMQTSSQPRTAKEPIRADRIFIGGRAGTADGAGSAAREPFQGEIFELLIYDRALATAETRALRAHLENKLAALTANPSSETGSAPAAAGTNPAPPTIQVLTAGFTARVLPLQLPNINFLRYRPDGRLFAGAYNGKVYVLRDTDGDGLEDRSDVYFEDKDVNVIMGMALTPPGYPRGEGVFIVSRGKALLLLDQDRDGKADDVLTVAEGWPPPRRAAGGVSDSLGIAVAPDGSLYFGIGADNFTNAYLLDAASGVSDYRLASERGTIQRVSPDFSRRDTMATGIRFSVGLAFNRDGELFATDQEGATWLPNGNPLDELLHIQPGRHYGFPPIHPKHLPSVVDEPSVFDYGPQHQSTVGLWFNEPLSDGGRIFGPSWWRGDALVSAMSRGKIYRTKLVRTPAGFIARNEIIAQLQRIIIDQAVAPNGALTVTLHSGKPDWGTGPRGIGELWQIAPVRELPPQPVIAWSENPREIRIAFDRPLDAEALRAVQGKVRAVQGRHAQAGDRFETMRPGYQVVKNEMAAPRLEIPVLGAALADEGRILTISTTERTAAVRYAISIEADVFRTGSAPPYGGQIDMQADLCGVEAEWRPIVGTPVRAWLPHADFNVSRKLLEPGSAAHGFFSQLADPGTVTLRGQLDLGLMLYPEVQAGAPIDWEYPAETVTLTIEARRPFRSQLGADNAVSQTSGQRHRSSHTVVTKKGTWLAYAVTFAHGLGDPEPTLTWTTDRSSTPRALPLRRFLVPYARPMSTAGTPPAEPSEVAGGNWIRGQSLFQAYCASCHEFRGMGTQVGPDLSHLAHRDYASVARDIHEPNAAINPEHVAYSFTMRDGSELAGVLVSESPDAVSVSLVGQGVRQIPRSDISAMSALSVSLMPPALDQAMGEERFRDLMRFLLEAGLDPAPTMEPNPPPPRSSAELEPVLRAVPAPAETEPLRPLRIVLCAAEKDAGHMRPGVHDYPLWRERWTKLLSLAPGVTTETADRWPTADQWRRADVVISFHNNPSWSAAKSQDIDAFLARGGGLVFLHYAIRAGTADRLALAQRVGHAWGEKGNVFRIGPTPLQFKRHEVTAGFPMDRTVPFVDETYSRMIGDLAGWTVLATSAEPSGDEPQVWLREAGAGRVFVCVPGHSTWTHDDPLYRLLVFRGALWTARQPLGRFNALATVGARLSR